MLTAGFAGAGFCPVWNGPSTLLPAGHRQVQTSPLSSEELPKTEEVEPAEELEELGEMG